MDTSSVAGGKRKRHHEQALQCGNYYLNTKLHTLAIATRLQ